MYLASSAIAAPFHAPNTNTASLDTIMQTVLTTLQPKTPANATSAPHAFLHITTLLSKGF